MHLPSLSSFLRLHCLGLSLRFEVCALLYGGFEFGGSGFEGLGAGLKVEGSEFTVKSFEIRVESFGFKEGEEIAERFAQP